MKVAWRDIIIVSVRVVIPVFKALIVSVSFDISLLWLSVVQCEHKYCVSSSPSLSKAGNQYTFREANPVTKKLCRPHSANQISELGLHRQYNFTVKKDHNYKK